jgi:uncharacterized DUF497 family protein
MDPNLRRSVIEQIDTRRKYGEQRIAAVGVVNGKELLLVYTWRGPNRRIISRGEQTVMKEKRTVYRRRAESEGRTD